METENQSAPETVVQTSTETASPSQSSDIPSTGSMQSASEAVEAPETPAYTPNYKIKAYDSEYEIPENFRGYINKDNEKNFREVFEKARFQR
jgi:septal ring-binding cell division protein DamX